ncbi:uncharacterized protein [Arachis hypogaea]|uniref:uncharacterized protein n=1 Tax=Arachis hypogaea TaxID=3818 RepID=UPI000DEC558B|nr:uncharacterized protein LOC112805739 [Arachis hypogaea]
MPIKEEAWNCPKKKKYETSKVQQPGRVFTTSAASVEGSETLIKGNCEVAGKSLTTLFDSRATNSFIAFEKASELGLKIVVLGYDLKVHNATSEVVVTSLDHNLGLVLLSKNSVLLNCSEKEAAFYVRRVRRAGCSKGVNCIGCGCEGVILLVTNASGEEQSLEQIPIVCEFSEVFPDDIPEFPPA